MINKETLIDYKIACEKTFSHKQSGMFYSLPTALKELVDQSGEFHTPHLHTWNQIVLNENARWQNCGEVVLPVEVILEVSTAACESTPRSISRCTRCLVLHRLYRGHIPTRYLVGQSSDNFMFYWTEI